MPTVEEIIQTNSAAVVVDEANHDPEEETEQISWSMSQVRKAVKEITYSLSSRPDKSVSEGKIDWCPHVRRLEKLSKDLQLIQVLSLRQVNIYSHFKD